MVLNMKEAKRMELPREVWMGPNVLEKTPETVRKLGLGEKGHIVSGEKTYKIAGEEVENSLLNSAFEINHTIVSQADTENVEKVLTNMEKPDFLLGIGGGKCIDVAKSASHKIEKPFLSIPTAASHDGISSSRAAIKSEEAKTSIEAQAPLSVIADTLIIQDSPFRLIAAGAGDMISNYTAVLDWELAREEKGEYVSEYASALSRMSAKLVAKNASIIEKATEESARKIVKALISSGVAMSIAGTSRPASGSEHLFSHALDRIAPEPALHGEQCAVGSVMMMKLHGEDWKSTRKALRKIGTPTNAKELGIRPKYIIKALTQAHKIRPERYTILRDGLDKEKANEIAKETDVI